MLSWNHAFQALHEYEASFKESAKTVKISDDFLPRLRSFRSLLSAVTKTGVLVDRQNVSSVNSPTMQFASTMVENSAFAIMDLFKTSSHKCSKLASIVPWLTLNPWNYPQQNRLQQQLRDSLQALDSLIQQLQQTIILFSTQEQAGQSSNQDLLKMLDYDACKNFWKEKIGLQTTKISLAEFAELFIHAMTTVGSGGSGEKYNAETFLTRILEYSFDRNDDHNISMMEVNQHIHQLIKHTIPTPLSITSSDQHFWQAMQKYFTNLQQQYAALLRLQVLKRGNEALPTTPNSAATQDRIVTLKPLQAMDFLCTIPTFLKHKYPYDYITLMKFPSYIHSVDDLYSSAHMQDILTNMTEVPSTRAFLSLSMNALYYGKEKKNWNISNFQKQILDLHTLLNSTTSSFTSARKDGTAGKHQSPSDVYNYEELQALLYLMEHSNMNTLTSFQYTPILPSPGVYTFRTVLPMHDYEKLEAEEVRKHDFTALENILNNPVAKSAYYKQSSSVEHFLPDFFAPSISETVEQFLAIPPPIKLNAPTNTVPNSPIVTVSAAMNQEDYTVKYIQLLELLFQVEQHSVMLQRDATEYNHINYLSSRLAQWKIDYGLKKRKKMLSQQATGVLVEGKSAEENEEIKNLIPVKMPVLSPVKTQVEFVQVYSHLLLPLPQILSEIHTLLVSFLHPASTLDLKHPQIQKILSQVVTLLQVIRHATSMTENDVAQVSELCGAIKRLIQFFINSRTADRNQNISTVVIVEQIHVIIDVAMEKAMKEQNVAMIDAKALVSILHQYIQDLYVQDILPAGKDKVSTAATRELFIAVYKFLWNGVMKQGTPEAKDLFGSPDSSVSASTTAAGTSAKENNRSSMRLSTAATNQTRPATVPTNALIKICEFIQLQRSVKTATTKTLALLQSVQTSLRDLEATWEEYLYVHSTAIKKTSTSDCCVPIFGGSKNSKNIKSKSDKLYHSIIEIQDLCWKFEVNTRYYYTTQFIEENEHSNLGRVVVSDSNSNTVQNTAVNKQDAVALLWQRLQLAVELKQFVQNIWLFQLKFALHSWYRVHGGNGNDVVYNSLSNMSFIQLSKTFAMDELTVLLHIYTFFQRVIQFLTPSYIVKDTKIPQAMQPIPIFKTMLLNAAKLSPVDTDSSSNDPEEVIKLEKVPKKHALRISIDHIATVLKQIQLDGKSNMKHISLQYCTVLRKIVLFYMQNVISSTLISSKKEEANRRGYNLSVQQSYLTYLQKIVVYLDDQIVKLSPSVPASLIGQDSTSTVVGATSDILPIPTTSQFISDVLQLTKILNELQLMITSLHSPSIDADNTNSGPVSMGTLSILMEAVQEIDMFLTEWKEYIFYSGHELENLNLIEQFSIADNIIPAQDVLIEIQDVPNLAWCSKTDGGDISNAEPLCFPINKGKDFREGTELVPFIDPKHPQVIHYKPYEVFKSTKTGNEKKNKDVDVIVIKKRKHQIENKGKQIVITKNEIEDPDMIFYLACHIPQYQLFPVLSDESRRQTTDHDIGEDETYTLQIQMIYSYPDPFAMTNTSNPSIHTTCDTKESLYLTNIPKTKNTFVLPLKFGTSYTSCKKSFDFNQITIVLKPILSVEISKLNLKNLPLLQEQKMTITIQNVDYLPTISTSNFLTHDNTTAPPRLAARTTSRESTGMISFTDSVHNGDDEEDEHKQSTAEDEEEESDGDDYYSEHAEQDSALYATDEEDLNAITPSVGATLTSGALAKLRKQHNRQGKRVSTALQDKKILRRLSTTAELFKDAANAHVQDETATVSSEISLNFNNSLAELLERNDPIALANHASTVFSMLPKTVFLPSVDKTHVLTRKEHVSAMHHQLKASKAPGGYASRSFSYAEDENEDNNGDDDLSGYGYFYQCDYCQRTGFGYVYVCDKCHITLHVQCAVHILSETMYAEDVTIDYSNVKNAANNDNSFTLRQPATSMIKATTPTKPSNGVTMEELHSPVITPTSSAKEIARNEGNVKKEESPIATEDCNMIEEVVNAQNAEDELEIKDVGNLVKREKLLWYGCDICHCNVYDIYYSYENNGQNFVVHPQCLNNDVLPGKYTKVNAQLQPLSQPHSADNRTNVFSTANPMASNTNHFNRPVLRKTTFANPEVKVPHTPTLLVTPKLNSVNNVPFSQSSAASSLFGAADDSDSENNRNPYALTPQSGVRPASRRHSLDYSALNKMAETPTAVTPVFVHRAPYKSLSEVQLRPTSMEVDHKDLQQLRTNIHATESGSVDGSYYSSREASDYEDHNPMQRASRKARVEQNHNSSSENLSMDSTIDKQPTVAHPTPVNNEVFKSPISHLNKVFELGASNDADAPQHERNNFEDVDADADADDENEHDRSEDKFNNINNITTITLASTTAPEFGVETDSSNIQETSMVDEVDNAGQDAESSFENLQNGTPVLQNLSVSSAKSMDKGLEVHVDSISRSLSGDSTTGLAYSHTPSVYDSDEERQGKRLSVRLSDVRDSDDDAEGSKNDTGDLLKQATAKIHASGLPINRASPSTVSSPATAAKVPLRTFSISAISSTASTPPVSSTPVEEIFQHLQEETKSVGPTPGLENSSTLVKSLSHEYLSNNQ